MWHPSIASTFSPIGVDASVPRFPLICVLLENMVLSGLSRYIWFGKPMNCSVLRIVQSLWQTTADLVPFTAARGSISPVERLWK